MCTEIWSTILFGPSLVQIVSLFKVEKINDFLQTIEERLKTLEEEKEELKEYQKWDRARRVLEFIIHDTEHRENKRKLEDVCFIFLLMFLFILSKKFFF